MGWVGNDIDNRTLHAVVGYNAWSNNGWRPSFQVFGGRRYNSCLRPATLQQDEPPVEKRKICEEEDGDLEEHDRRRL